MSPDRVKMTRPLGGAALTAVLLAAAALAATASACTIVAPSKPDGGSKVVIVPIRPDALPPPKSLEASVLVVANLETGTANLSQQYASIIIGLAKYLTAVGLQIDEMGLISTYADQFGPRLLLGRKTTGTDDAQVSALAAAVAAASAAGVHDYDSLLPFINQVLGNISDQDLPVALNLLSSSGAFNGDGETSEAKNVIQFGAGVDSAALPAAQGGIDRNAFFSTSHDLFIIVYIQPLPRRCALGSAACRVNGRDPSAIFEDTDASGKATWLNLPGGGLRPDQIIQVSIATSEGETLDDFRTRCSQVPGFPLNLFDVMAPSSNAFFGPLMSALNDAHPGTGHSGDFCELIGSSPSQAIKELGTGVAAATGGP